MVESRSGHKFRARRHRDADGVKPAPTASTLQLPQADQDSISFGGSDIESENPLYNGENPMPYVVEQKPGTPELAGNFPEWPSDGIAGLQLTPEMQHIKRGVPKTELQHRLHEAEARVADLEQKVAEKEEDLQLEKLSNEQLRSNRDNLSRDQESKQAQLRADLESSTREERFQRERAAKFEEKVLELEEELHLEQLSSKSMQQERDRLSHQVKEQDQQLQMSEQAVAAAQADLTTLKESKEKLEVQLASQTEVSEARLQDLEKKSVEMDQLRIEVAQLSCQFMTEAEGSASVQEALEQLRAEREVMESEHETQLQQARLQQEQLMKQLQESDQIRCEKDQLQSKHGVEVQRLSIPEVSEAQRVSIKDEMESSFDPQQPVPSSCDPDHVQLLEEENQHLQQQAIDLEQKYEEMRYELKGVHAEKEELASEVVEKTSHLQLLEKERQHLQQQAYDLEQKHEEMSRELKGVRAEKEELASEVVEKTSHLQLLDEEKQHLQQQAYDSQKKHEEMSQELKDVHAEKEDLASKVDEKTRHMERLEKLVNTLEKMQEQNSEAHLQRELQVTMLEKERAFENLNKADAQTVRANAALLAKQEEMDELRRMNAQLVADLTSKQTEKAQEALNTIKVMEESRKVLEMEHAGMTERMQLLHEQLADSRLDHTSLTSEHAVLKDKFNSLQERDEANRVSLQENSVLTEKVKLLDDQLCAAIAAKDNALSELAVTTLKLTQFGEKFDTKQVELNELQAAHAASQASLDELRDAHATSQASLAEANDRWNAHLEEVRKAEEKLQSGSEATPEDAPAKDTEESHGKEAKEEIEPGQVDEQKEEKASHQFPCSTQFAPLVAVYDHMDSDMGWRRIIRIQVPGRHLCSDGQPSVSGTVQPLANGVLVSLSKLPDFPHDAEVVQPYFMIDQTGTWEWKYEPLDGPWGLRESWGIAHGVLAIILQRIKDGEACTLSEEKRVQPVRVPRSSVTHRPPITSRSEGRGHESVDPLLQSSATIDEDKQPQQEKAKRLSSYKIRLESPYAVLAARLPTGNSVCMQFPPELVFLSRSGHMITAGNLSVGVMLRGPYGLVEVSAVSLVHPQGRTIMRLYMGLHALSVLPEQQLLAGLVATDDPAAVHWDLIEARQLSANSHELSLHRPGGIEDSAVLTAVKRMVAKREHSSLSLPLVEVELVLQAGAAGRLKPSEVNTSLARCGLFVALQSAMPKTIHPAMAKSASASALLSGASAPPNAQVPKAASASPVMGSTAQKAPAAAKRRSTSQSAPQVGGAGAAAVLAEQLALQDTERRSLKR